MFSGFWSMWRKGIRERGIEYGQSMKFLMNFERMFYFVDKIWI